jgi:toxin ParE1/3/4
VIPCRLASAAENDLRAIFWQGIELFGALQTERYVTEIEAQFDFLSAYPEAARLRADLEPPVRALPHGAHIIIYEIQDDAVVVLRIRSARENWMAAPVGDEQP